MATQIVVEDALTWTQDRAPGTTSTLHLGGDGLRSLLLVQELPQLNEVLLRQVIGMQLPLGKVELRWDWTVFFLLACLCGVVVSIALRTAVLTPTMRATPMSCPSSAAVYGIMLSNRFGDATVDRDGLL